MGKYNYWTPEDRVTLIDAWNEGKSLLEILELLPHRKSSDAIRMQLQLLRKQGVNLAHRHHSARALGSKRAEEVKREKEIRDAAEERLRRPWRSMELWPDENSGVILFTDNVKTVAVGKLPQSPLNRSYGTASNWAVKDGI